MSGDSTTVTEWQCMKCRERWKGAYPSIPGTCSRVDLSLTTSVNHLWAPAKPVEPFAIGDTVEVTVMGGVTEITPSTVEVEVYGHGKFFYRHDRVRPMVDAFREPRESYPRNYLRVLAEFVNFRANQGRHIEGVPSAVAEIARRVLEGEPPQHRDALGGPVSCANAERHIERLKEYLGDANDEVERLRAVVDAARELYEDHIDPSKEYAQALGAALAKLDAK